MRKQLAQVWRKIGKFIPESERFKNPNYACYLVPEVRGKYDTQNSVQQTSSLATFAPITQIYSLRHLRRRLVLLLSGRGKLTYQQGRRTGSCGVHELHSAKKAGTSKKRTA